MLKVFKKELTNGHIEVKIIDIETGEIKYYNTCKQLGFPFGTINQSTVYDMGYNSVKEYIKTMKERNFLGSEVDYKDQRESERIGYIKLGMERIKRHNRINTRDFEDVIGKLKEYGMNYVDAQNCIVGNYLYYAEQEEQII